MDCGAARRDLGREAYGPSRKSTQRIAIAEAAETLADHAFSAEELASEVRGHLPGIGVATVYRAVAAMSSTGFIEPVGVRDGAVLFARCGHSGHHHHLVCTSCGAVRDAECPVRVDPAREMGGFRVTSHDLVLYGLCPPCQLMATEPQCAQEPVTPDNGRAEGRVHARRRTS
jgi:Fe2+ or Zn2+ uptake regulation protein